MKCLIMLYGSQQDYDRLAGKTDPAATSAADVAALQAQMASVHEELDASGELVDTRGLSAPAHARRVQVRNRVPVVTDGPYAETEEVLAGFTIVECDSFDRATEIAGRLVDPDSEGEFADVRPIIEGIEELEV